MVGVARWVAALTVGATAYLGVVISGMASRSDDDVREAMLGLGVSVLLAIVAYLLAPGRSGTATGPESAAAADTVPGVHACVVRSRGSRWGGLFVGGLVTLVARTADGHRVEVDEAPAARLARVRVRVDGRALYVTKDGPGRLSVRGQDGEPLLLVSGAVEDRTGRFELVASRPSGQTVRAGYVERWLAPPLMFDDVALAVAQLLALAGVDRSLGGMRRLAQTAQRSRWREADVDWCDGDHPTEE